MGNVVDAGGAATEVGIGDGCQFQSGDLFQQVARLLADALGVYEVAGVVVRHPLGHGAQWSA